MIVCVARLEMPEELSMKGKKMKSKLFNTVICLILGVLNFNSVFGATNFWTYYNDANNWIGNTMVVTEDLQLYGNFTFPEDETIKVYNGYTINVPSDYTLTINGGIEAGSYQIFDDDHIYTSPGIAGNPKVEFINPCWWDFRSGIGESEYKKLQRSIDLAANYSSGISGGLVRLPYEKSDVELENTVTIKKGVIFDGQWNNFVIVNNYDVFHVNDSAQLRNVAIGHADLSPSDYTKTFVTLKPTQHMKGNNSGLWLSGLRAVFRNNTGNAVFYDASSYYIQGTIAENIQCQDGDTCVLLKAGGTFGDPAEDTYCNGNLITNIAAHYPEYTIYERHTDVVGGNSYVNVLAQPLRSDPTNHRAKIQLNEGSVLAGGALWDRPAIQLKNDGNIIMGYCSPQTSITDDGNDNRMIITGAHYFDGSWLVE